MASTSYGALEAHEDYVGDNGEGAEYPNKATMHQPGSQEKSKIFFSRTIAVVAVILVASGLTLMADIWRPTSLKASGIQSTLSMDTSTNSLVVSSVSNDYGVRDLSAMLAYPFLADALLIEPYRETTVALADPYAGCTYAWSFLKTADGTTAASGTSTDGSIILTLTATGEYTFNVVESCDAIDSSRALTVTVWTKYVRREISTLTEADRDEFLDAFHTLWTVSTTQGILLYGPKYKSINFFATLHNDGGGNPVCDEFHGGLGFLNNHMYLSAYLEQSLQLINPRVSLHYLEYTKYFESDAYRSHLQTQLDGGSWTDILSSKFFGSSDPDTGRILDGRWQDTAVPTITLDFLIEEGIDPELTFFRADEVAWLERAKPHLSSPYGLLRSPWNYNPSPYLARYGNVFGISNSSIIGDRDIVFKYHMGVTCDAFQSFFSTIKGQPLEDYLFQMEDDTHGIFHFTFGGVGGTKAKEAVQNLRDNYGFSYSNVAALAISAQPFFKKYLATNNHAPVNCTSKPWQNDALVTTIGPGEVGGPSCDFADFYYATEDELDGLISFFFDIDPDHFDETVLHMATLDFAQKTAVMKIIGNMFPMDGDLAGSGAALDPLFWVAHGAMERTFQKSVLAGIFSDMEFNTVDKCGGHDYATAKNWLSGFHFPDDTIQAQKLSNQALTAILDPSSDSYRDLINFVYDTSAIEECDGSEDWFA